MAKNSKQPPDIAQADPKVAAFEAQLADLTAALQRERADAINQRRRFDEQLASVRTTVKSNVIAELLPVIDNFERALKHAPTRDNGKQTTSSTAEGEALAWYKWAEGVQNVVKQFEASLKAMGVERIATVGQPFDPNLHEAVSMEEGDGDHEVVSEELQAGYKIGNDVIRHAMVRVKSI